MTNKTKKIALVSIFALVAIALGIWQFKKEDIVQNAIERAVSKGSDGLYKIQYDSSKIDELAGNASFYNIKLIGDSTKNTDSKSSVFNIAVGEVSITGADIPALLAGKAVRTKTIYIKRPVVTIFTSKQNDKPTAQDSAALYEQILGKFNNISADKIIIEDGTVSLSKKNAAPHVSLQGFFAEVDNFKVDSTRNYNDIASFFIRQTKASVKAAQLTNPQGQQTILENIVYNADQKQFSIQKIINRKQDGLNNEIFLAGLSLSGLNTTAFVFENKLVADTLRLQKGNIEIVQKAGASNAKKTFDIRNDFFSGLRVKNITVEDVDLLLSFAEKNKAPLTIKNVSFRALRLPGTNGIVQVQDLLANGQWEFSASGFNLKTADNIYNIGVAGIKLSDITKTANIQTVHLKPNISWAAYAATLKTQHDLYDFKLTNISAKNVKADALLQNDGFLAEELILTPDILSSNDRTVPFDKTSKVGQYLQQMLLALDFPVSVSKVQVRNGKVTYRERGRASKQVGDVVFTNINGTISNVTNIPSKIAQNGVMVLNAKANFLGSTPIQTNWQLPLTKGNAVFTVAGKFGGITKAQLNPVLSPLGMAAIDKGEITGVDFSIKGNDYKSWGTATVKYKNLKIDILDNENGTLDDRDALGFVANLLVKNNNPRNGKLQTANIDFARDTTKSFFKLVFKSILQATKKTVL